MRPPKKPITSALVISMSALCLNQATANASEESVDGISATTAKTQFVKAAIFGQGPLSDDLGTENSVKIKVQQREIIRRATQQVVSDPKFSPIWGKITSGNPYQVDKALSNLYPIAVEALAEYAPTPKPKEAANRIIGEAGDGVSPNCLFFIAVVEAVSVATTALGASQVAVVHLVALTKKYVGTNVKSKNEFTSRRLVAKIVEEMDAYQGLSAG